MSVQVVRIHAAAPAKPPVGDACNGCGVCCAAEPCPLGVVLSRRLQGACAALVWDGWRYRCGALARSPRWLRSVLSRWIAAGRGCDSDASY